MQTLSADRYHRYRRYFTGVGILYKKKKAKVYTEIVLSILTIAFFSFFAIRPTLITISSLLKEIKDKKSIANQMEQKINSLVKAQANYSQIKPDFYLIDQSLPQNPDLSILVKQMESLAQLSSVNLETVSYGKTNLQGEVGKKEIQTIGLSLNLSGDYQNLKSFLNSLDTLRRIVSIDSFIFSLKSSKKEKETRSLTLTINAKAYYFIKNP